MRSKIGFRPPVFVDTERGFDNISRQTLPSRWFFRPHDPVNFGELCEGYALNARHTVKKIFERAHVRTDPPASMEALGNSFK